MMPKDVQGKTEETTEAGEVRRTFIINAEHANKINSIAYWERLKIKDVLSSALSEYIERYEKKNGPVKEPSTSK